jgi:hypothetical protein
VLPPARPLTSPPPPGPYALMDFYDAVEMYIREAGEPRTVRQIAEGLLAGGYFTTSANFPSVTRTMLQRRSGFPSFKMRTTADRSRWYVKKPDPDETP